MAGNLHVGKAGQLAALSEFLLHGYNVAIPEVDIGDDAYVVHDQLGRVWRLQVKTTNGIRMRYGYSGRFQVPLKQFWAELVPPLVYVLVLRMGIGHWEMVVISQSDLQEEHRTYGVGTSQAETLDLYLAFREIDVVCSGRSFQRYRNNCDLSPYL
jgi:hypothetical protein